MTERGVVLNCLAGLKEGEGRWLGQWERRRVALGCSLYHSVAPNSHLAGLCQGLSEKFHHFQVCQQEVCQEEPCCSVLQPPRSREGQRHIFFASSVCREHGFE